jgi:hypothetical protein
LLTGEYLERHPLVTEATVTELYGEGLTQAVRSKILCDAITDNLKIKAADKQTYISMYGLIKQCLHDETMDRIRESHEQWMEIERDQSPLLLWC